MKSTNWDVYFDKQMSDAEIRGLVEEELKALRIGAQLAKIRRQKRLSQTQLAARVGMSGPNISRIENSPSQNMTIGTLVRLARALGREVEIELPLRRTVTRGSRAVRASGMKDPAYRDQRDRTRTAAFRLRTERYRNR